MASAENGSGEFASPVCTDHIIIQDQITQDEKFTSIPLDKKNKQPRRVLHFSDGVLEEYSTDEEDETDAKSVKVQAVDPKALSWASWLWYWTITSATKTLAAADFCGEKLAWAFGITSPKYQYAIDEYHRMKDLEEEEKLREEKVKVIQDEKKTKLVKVMEGGLPSEPVKKF